MDINFGCYRFLPDQLVLYKDDDIVELKRNQALLLKFFLSDPKSIHSKEAIMNAVWQDRVVSEQVVFQTISQLRALFGADAIKTFSKKGYKWQFSKNTESLAPINTDATKTTPEQPPQAKLQAKKPPVVQIAIYLSILLLLTFFYSKPNTQSNQQNEELHQQKRVKSPDIYLLTSESQLTPSQLTFHKIATQVLRKSEGNSLKSHPLAFSVKQAFTTPARVWHNSSLNNNQWLIWGDTFHSDKGIFLQLGLAHNNTTWQSYLYGENLTELTQALQKKLDTLTNIGLFLPNNSELSINNLLAMNTISMDEPDVLYLLADRYIDINQLDVAMTYLERLLQRDKSYAASAYQAKAQWLIGKIFKIRSQHQQADNRLAKMSTILQDTPLWPLTFQNITTKAWLAYKKSNYQEMFQVLDKGIQLGKSQAEPLTLFELHILYSILARNANDDHKKYQHLNEAQALLLKHQLDESNQAVVYYHFALFTQDNTKALPYLKHILALPRTAQNYWVHDDAFEMLVQHYLEQGDFTQARAQFTKVRKSPKQLLLLAKVMQAQQQTTEVKDTLQQSFDLARLQHDTHSALQAALMLYQLSSTEPEKQAEYYAFIESNASKNWLKINNDVLAKQ